MDSQLDKASRIYAELSLNFDDFDVGLFQIQQLITQNSFFLPIQFHVFDLAE